MVPPIFELAIANLLCQVNLLYQDSPLQAWPEANPVKRICHSCA